MSIIDIIGWAVFFYLMWQLLTAWIWYNKFKHAVNEAVKNDILQAEIDEQIQIFSLEKIEHNGNNVLLVYDNNKFITQGNTQEEVNTLLKVLFPKKNIVLVSEKES